MKTVCDTETDAIAELLDENVFVRSVTHYYTGRLAGYDDRFLVLDDAAWVADTGRFSDALGTGTLAEVEPYPGRCYVAVGGIIDISKWIHDLPRSKK